MYNVIVMCIILTHFSFNVTPLRVVNHIDKLAVNTTKNTKVIRVTKIGVKNNYWDSYETLKKTKSDSVNSIIKIKEIRMVIHTHKKVVS